MSMPKPPGLMGYTTTTYNHYAYVCMCVCVPLALVSGYISFLGGSFKGKTQGTPLPTEATHRVEATKTPPSSKFRPRPCQKTGKNLGNGYHQGSFGCLCLRVADFHWVGLKGNKQEQKHIWEILGGFWVGLKGNKQEPKHTHTHTHIWEVSLF